MMLLPTFNVLLLHVNLPLMVDIDTGWGGAFNIAKTIRDMEKAGAAAVHYRRSSRTKTLWSSSK